MPGRTRIALAAALLAAACARAPTATAVEPEEDELSADEPLADLVRRTRELIRRQDEALWAHWTEGAPLAIDATDAEERALYAREAIALIDSRRPAIRGRLEGRALDQLRVHFAGEALARAVEKEADALAAAEGALTFLHAGQKRPLHELERVLARERNALVRQEVYGEASARLEKLAPALRARRARELEVLRELGYADAGAWAQALHRTELDALARHASRILEATGPAFRKVIDELATRELRLPLDRVRLRDLPRMFRSREVDDLFPKEAIGARASATARGLGIDLAALPGFRLDDRDLPEKNPLPLALAVQIPGDVRLSVKPLDGLRAQSAFLHELGHALHAASTRERRYALSKLGAAGASEAWSLLFELLVEDPAWLEEQARLSGPRRDPYLAASAAWDLYLLRRSAGQLLYGIALVGGAEPRAAYREVMERAMLVPIEPEDESRAEAEAASSLDAARTLEAELLAHQLQSQLRTRFGAAWWRSEDAGAFLRSLWAHGHALDARELANAAGEDALSPEPLLARLSSALKLQLAGPDGAARERD